MSDPRGEAFTNQVSDNVTKLQPKTIELHYTDEQDPELTRLATALTNGDARVVALEEAEIEFTEPGIPPTDPRLDPQNALFDFRVWASTFIRLLKRDGISKPTVGFTFQNLSVHGPAAGSRTQQTVASPFRSILRLPQVFRHKGPPSQVNILDKLNGSVRDGQMLLVLGRPGSGCTTFLKSISGQLRSLSKSDDSIIQYHGVPQDVFLKEFKAEAVYNQELDEHFPHLTVGQTLNFAAAARTPHSRLNNMSRTTFSHYFAEVIMKIFGLSHTRDTKVGNDVVRGVSGGERKRVSIAEMALSRPSVAVWDNSTRGLDAATALDFVKSLRNAADIVGTAQAVTLYQASESIYSLFDKVMVLYEGRQIYFGPVTEARTYFERMGWHCPPRQPTPDFLTSVTNPSERRPRDGFTDRLPRTAAEFQEYWHQSEWFQACLRQITEAEEQHSRSGVNHLTSLRQSKHRAQAKHTRLRSPYILSVPMQVRLCMRRSYQRLLNDKGSTVSMAVGRVVLALIIGSIFYGASHTTASLSSNGSIIFLAVLLNALMSVTEINTIYDKRPIVLKQSNYAFYHPFAEALGEILVDLPVKFVITTIFNVIFYFLSGLRPEPSNFFIFLLFNFFCTLLMSALFRTIGASAKQISQAFGLAGITILSMIIYTGFTLQTRYMHPWFRWINYINPIAYIFEALLVNEVHGQDYPCATQNLVPPYGKGDYFACAVIGSRPGSTSVRGDDWVTSGYGYEYSHLWRNFGILVAFMLTFYTLYLVAIEYSSAGATMPQSLVFRRGHAPNAASHSRQDIESGSTPTKEPGPSDMIAPSDASSQHLKSDVSQRATLAWQGITLDITIKGQPRRLLDHVSGYVVPGTLTALMGVSGAGKTTLLDTLAQRCSIGVLSGDILLDGAKLGPSFPRKTGYVQQQDLHLESSTVREALRFSALLRQPAAVTQEEKYTYVEKVIQMLDMEAFSDAIVGRPGEGLNIEQRKLLTIGVELAAKPSILFLDEPTSGLDSQSAWTIIAFMRKLAESGQAVLSTIHQPSAVMFQAFDSLLLMSKGGKVSYFGKLGHDCQTLIGYFEGAGARSCSHDENPAEYVLDVVGTHSDRDWHQTWTSSEECKMFQRDLDSVIARRNATPLVKDEDKEFAVGFTTQAYLVTFRLFQLYWRDPAFIYGKIMPGIASALFIGFSFFLQDGSATGFQNSVFAVFMLNATFSTIVNQIMPKFVAQRTLFETREAPSKMYSWTAFLFGSMIVELPYQLLLSILVYAAWYFPVFGAHQDADSQGMMLAFCIQFYLYASTFAQMVIAAMPNVQVAGAISTILFSLTLQFNGVLQPPQALPGFWIFMYRVSPFTYLIGGWTGTALAQRAVVCAANELARFDPPPGHSCRSYLSDFLAAGAPGHLVNPAATADCGYCPISNGAQFLAGSHIYRSERYRNLGIGFAYVAFNIFAAVSLYYVFRVKRFSLGHVIKSRRHRKNSTDHIPSDLPEKKKQKQGI